MTTNQRTTSATALPKQKKSLFRKISEKVIDRYGNKSSHAPAKPMEFTIHESMLYPCKPGRRSMTIMNN